MRVMMVLLCATALGLAAERLRVAGGLMLGAVVGAGLVSLAGGRSIGIPAPIQTLAIVIVGASIGAEIDVEALGRLRGLWVPAAVSSIRPHRDGPRDLTTAPSQWLGARW